MPNEKFTEKRQERRFPISATVLITVANNKTVEGVCRNISGSGLLVETDKLVRTGRQVRIDIQKGRINFSADATIVRAEEQDGKFLLGVHVDKKIPRE
jgi:hypothetical protein